MCPLNTKRTCSLPRIEIQVSKTQNTQEIAFITERGKLYRNKKDIIPK